MDLFKHIITEKTVFSPYTNVFTMVMCIIILISLAALPQHHGKSFKFMTASCISIFFGSFFGCLYYYVFIPGIAHFQVDTIFLMRFLYYFFMITTLFIFLLFVIDITGIDIHSHLPVLSMTYAGWIIALYSSQYTHIGFWIGGDKKIHESYFFDVYTFCFLFYFFTTGWIIMSSKRIIYTRIKICMGMVFTIFMIVNFLQAVFVTDTFVNPSMMIPFLYFLLAFRQNSYDRRKNCMNSDTFIGNVSDLIKKKKEYHIGVVQADRLGILLEANDAAVAIRAFCHSAGYKGMIYRLDDDRLAVISEKPFDTDKVSCGLERLYKKLGEEYKGLFISGRKTIKNGRDMLFIIDHFSGGIYDRKMTSVDDISDIDTKISSLITSRDTLIDIAAKADLSDDRVRVFCQPIYDTCSERIISAEALMRIYVPDHGFLFPGTFIPLAEKLGLIHPLSLIIFDKVCRYLSENTEQRMVTVNFSTDEFLKEDFTDELLRITEKYGVDPARIGIEITESRLEKNFRLLKASMEKLTKTGFIILIDDFGTGYSNLNRIFELPVSVVKFDRSLLISAEKNDNNEILGQLVSIFKHLGIQTLCEGIETENDEYICQRQGFDYLQGYLYSRPVPIENLAKIIQKHDEPKPVLWK